MGYVTPGRIRLPFEGAMIILDLLSDSVLIALTSFGVAFAMSWLVQPHFRNLGFLTDIVNEETLVRSANRYNRVFVPGNPKLTEAAEQAL